MKIGILGAGQLSRMLALSGIPMGLEFEFYSPETENCVSSLGKVTVGAYDDWAQLNAFASRCDVVTFENENIPFETLRDLDEKTVVYPKAKAIQQSQDRLVEKTLFKLLDIPTVPFRAIESRDDLMAFIEEVGYPLILKTRRNGYDGKGQYKIESINDIDNINIIGKTPLIVEKMINYNREISIIGVRSQSRDTAFYDICENQHVNGVLHKTLNKQRDPRMPLAKNYLTKLMNELNYFGVITLELFDTNDGLLANEIAPRVHNSGHWTIEGTVCSQFANHIRAIAGYQLGATDSHGTYEMINMLGKVADPLEVLSKPHQTFHDYQKTPKPGRKMGHIVTVLKI